MKVTVKDLEAPPRGKRACEEQVILFRETFPRGCQVTAANIRKAQTVGLDIGWWAEEFLSAAALRAYQEEATAAALKAYQEATAATTLIAVLGLKEKP